MSVLRFEAPERGPSRTKHVVAALTMLVGLAGFGILLSAFG
jgi:hypothetical protein